MRDITTESKRRGIGRFRLFICALAAAAILTGCGDSRPTADELARQWVIDSVNTVSELVAAWMVAFYPALTLLDSAIGDYIEERIHQVIEWDFSPSVERSDGLYSVAATSQISFDLPSDAGRVEAGIPWEMVVDRDTGNVDANPQFDDAYMEAPIVSEAVEKAKEKLGDEAKEAREKLGDEAEKAKEKAKDLFNKVK